jgi:guanyl-specific ribonuclease Sa
VTYEGAAATASVAAGLTPADLAGAAMGVSGAIKGLSAPRLAANGTVVPRIVSGTLPTAEEAVIKTTMDHIIAGTTPSGNLGVRWGIPFQNRAGELPGGQYAASPYQEYRVAPLPGQTGAGPNRIVVNSATGEMYYTWNHYGGRNAKPPFVQVK